MQQHLLTKSYLPKQNSNQIGVISRQDYFISFRQKPTRNFCSVSSSGSSFPIEGSSLMGLDFLLTPLL